MGVSDRSIDGAAVRKAVQLCAEPHLRVGHCLAGSHQGEQRSLYLLCRRMGQGRHHARLYCNSPRRSCPLLHRRPSRLAFSRMASHIHAERESIFFSTSATSAGIRRPIDPTLATVFFRPEFSLFPPQDFVVSLLNSIIPIMFNTNKGINVSIYVGLNNKIGSKNLLYEVIWIKILCNIEKCF